MKNIPAIIILTLFFLSSAWIGFEIVVQRGFLSLIVDVLSLMLIVRVLDVSIRHIAGDRA